MSDQTFGSVCVVLKNNLVFKKYAKQLANKNDNDTFFVIFPIFKTTWKEYLAYQSHIFKEMGFVFVTRLERRTCGNANTNEAKNVNEYLPSFWNGWIFVQGLGFLEKCFFLEGTYVIDQFWILCCRWLPLTTDSFVQS